MAFPVRPILVPSVLSGKSNGRLPSDILITIPGKPRGQDLRLVTPAARSVKALVAAADAAHVTLRAVSSYRPYEIQVAIFTDRYTTTYLPGRPSKVWQGRRYWQKLGTATAAVPGFSNHGWGLAIDWEVNGRITDWLVANEQRYGFSHEIQTEPWHIRYFSGDFIMPAVREYEAGQKPKPPKPQPPTPTPEDDDVRYLIKKANDPKWWITDGIFKRHVNDRAEALVLVNSKLCVADNGQPFVWPDAVVDDITVS